MEEVVDPGAVAGVIPALEAVLVPPVVGPDPDPDPDPGAAPIPDRVPDLEMEIVRTRSRLQTLLQVVKTGLIPDPDHVQSLDPDHGHDLKKKKKVEINKQIILINFFFSPFSMIYGLFRKLISMC